MRNFLPYHSILNLVFFLTYQEDSGLKLDLREGEKAKTP